MNDNFSSMKIGAQRVRQRGEAKKEKIHETPAPSPPLPSPPYPRAAPGRRLTPAASREKGGKLVHPVSHHGGALRPRGHTSFSFPTSFHAYAIQIHFSPESRNTASCLTHTWLNRCPVSSWCQAVFPKNEYFKKTGFELVSNKPFK